MSLPTSNYFVVLCLFLLYACFNASTMSAPNRFVKNYKSKSSFDLWFSSAKKEYGAFKGKMVNGKFHHLWPSYEVVVDSVFDQWEKS